MSNALRIHRLIGNVCVVLLFSFSAWFSVYGREYKFVPPDQEFLANSSYIYDVVQDDRGFLWFGTGYGLIRFDGYEIQRFFSGDPGEEAPVSKVIRFIEFDRSGQFWLGTDLGLMLFDPAAESVVNFPISDSPDILNGTLVRQMVFLDDRKILLLREADILLFDRESGGYEQWRPDGLSSAGTPSSLLKIGGGKILVGGRGILEYDLLSGSITPVLLTDEAGSQVQALAPLRDGRVAVVLLNGDLLFLSRDYQITEKVNLLASADNESIAVTALLEDRDGVLWIASNGQGLLRWDSEGDGLEQYRENPAVAMTLQSNYLSSLFEDRQGILWISSLWNGVTMVNREGKKFISIQSIPDDPNTPDSNNITAVAADKNGFLWFGTSHTALSRYDPSAETISRITRDQHGKAVDFSLLVTIRIDGQGRFWMTSWMNGLHFFDPETLEWKNWPHNSENPDDPGSPGGGNLYGLYLDPSGMIWIGHSSGLDLFDPETGIFTHYRHDSENPESILPGTVNDIAPLPNGELLLSCLGSGISILNRETGRFRHLVHDGDNPQSLPSNSIWKIHVSGDEVWMAGSTGLILYDYESGSFDLYSDSNGFPFNDIVTIAEDKKGFLWLGVTAPEIIRFNTEDGSFYRYSRSDGIIPKGFNVPTALIPSGELFFISYGGGICRFDPESFHINEYQPPVVFSRFQIFNRDINPRNSPEEWPINLDRLDELELAFRDSYFSIQVSVLNYWNPEKNRFSYKLEGYDPEWTERTADRRFISFSSLPSGHYVLKIRGSNDDGIWSDEVRELPIRIIPPLWRRWWALLSYVLIIGSVIAFGTNYLLNKKEQIIRHQQIELSRERERQQAIADLNTTNEKYALLFKTIPDPIFLVDGRSHFILESNQSAERVFYTEAALLEQLKLEDLFGGTSNVDLQAVLMKKSLNGPHYLTFEHKGSKTRILEVYSSYFKFPASSGWIVGFRDITARKHFEELAIQSDKMLSIGSLAAGMAHDVKNPLAAINQTAQVLERRLLSSLKANEKSAAKVGLDLALLGEYLRDRNIPNLLEGLRRSVTRASDIILTMLQFSRKSDRKKDYHDPAGMMDETLSLARNEYNVNTRYDFKKIRLIRRYEKDLPPIRCRKSQIQQVFLNILINGAQAMTEAGTPDPRFELEIQAERDSGICFSIKDNGPGIESEVMENLFFPFYSTKSMKEGTGLGLSIAKHIIEENHSGRIRAESDFGSGAKFIIYLPYSHRNRNNP